MKTLPKFPASPAPRARAARLARRCGLAAAALVLPWWSLSAASILQGSRSLAAVLDVVDYGPLAGDETADFGGDGTLAPAFADAVATTNVQNDNSATGTAQQNTTLDAAGLKFGGTGGAALAVRTNFDAADAASGAFVDALASSSYSVAFRIEKSGKLALAGTLQATGAGQRAWVRLERWDGSGVALWSRQISAGSEEFSAEIPLTTGNYLVQVNAISDLEVHAAGAATASGSAAYAFNAQVVEVISGKPPKPRK